MAISCRKAGLGDGHRARLFSQTSLRIERTLLRQYSSASFFRSSGCSPAVSWHNFSKLYVILTSYFHFVSVDEHLSKLETGKFWRCIVRKLSLIGVVLMTLLPMAAFARGAVVVVGPAFGGYGWYGPYYGPYAYGPYSVAN